MAVPNKAVGYGNASTARNVFSATFSTALSSAVKYEVYDGGTYPAVGAVTTVANEMFTATPPYLSLVDTTNAAPASSWKPGSATGGGAVQINRMKGQTNWVTQAGANVGAAGRITWNMVLEIPSTATTGSTACAHDLLLRYTYTGGAPTVAFFFNDAVSGTEGTPTWTAVSVPTNGIRHCRAGSGVGNYLANIPTSSTEDTTEGWIAP